MKNFVLALSIIFMSLFFYSCASVPSMVLNEKSKGLDISSNTVALMTLKISNQYQPDQQWDAKYVVFDKWKIFSLNAPYKKVEKEYNEYLISVEMPPGEYELKTISGQTGESAVSGLFTIPLYLNFSLEPNKIVYLGHVEAINRKRINDKEVRSVGVNYLSPIQMAIDSKKGLYETTFDVSIYDRYNDDAAIFKEKYPFLSNQDIGKMILPKWIRIEERDAE